MGVPRRAAAQPPRERLPVRPRLGPQPAQRVRLPRGHLQPAEDGAHLRPGRAVLLPGAHARPRRLHREHAVPQPRGSGVRVQARRPQDAVQRRLRRPAARRQLAGVLRRARRRRDQVPPRRVRRGEDAREDLRHPRPGELPRRPPPRGPRNPASPLPTIDDNTRSPRTPRPRAVRFRKILPRPAPAASHSRPYPCARTLSTSSSSSSSRPGLSFLWQYADKNWLPKPDGREGAKRAARPRSSGERGRGASARPPSDGRRAGERAGGGLAVVDRPPPGRREVAGRRPTPGRRAARGTTPPPAADRRPRRTGPRSIALGDDDVLQPRPAHHPRRRRAAGRAAGVRARPTGSAARSTDGNRPAVPRSPGVDRAPGQPVAHPDPRDGSARPDLERPARCPTVRSTWPSRRTPSSTTRRRTTSTPTRTSARRTGRSSPRSGPTAATQGRRSRPNSATRTSSRSARRTRSGRRTTTSG